MSRFMPHKATPKLRSLHSQTPVLYFTPKAIQTMRIYVEECNNEISWLGTVEKHPNNVFLCTEVHLLYQDVSGSTTEIQPEGLVKFAEEIGLEKMEEVRLWGHSHVDMATSASIQDENQMVLFQNNGFDWYFRIIANKKGSITVTFYNYAMGYVVDDVPWDIHYDVALDCEAIKQEVKAKVSKLQTVVTGFSTSFWNKPDGSYDGEIRRFGDSEYEWCAQYGYWRWLGYSKSSGDADPKKKPDAANQTASQENQSDKESDKETVGGPDEAAMLEMAEDEYVAYISEEVAQEVLDSFSLKDIAKIMSKKASCGTHTHFSSLPETKLILQKYGITYEQFVACCKLNLS